MPKVFELGLPNPGVRGRQIKAANDPAQTIQRTNSSNPYAHRNGSFGGGYNAEPLRAPRSPKEEEEEVRGSQEGGGERPMMEIYLYVVEAV